jgi:hypothetical protein
MSKPRRLKRLRIDEISAVDVGAGRGVRIMLTKRHPAGFTENRPMKTREIIKRAATVGDIDRDTLMVALQKRAVREHPEAATKEVAFARYVDANPGIIGLMKSAPPAPQADPPRSSFEALARSAAAHNAAAGVPGAGYYTDFLKANVPSSGLRDAENDQIQDQTSKATRAVAESMVPAKFDSVEVALRYMRSSSRYAHLFKAPAGFAESRADMLQARSDTRNRIQGPGPSPRPSMPNEAIADPRGRWIG